MATEAASEAVYVENTIELIKEFGETFPLPSCLERPHAYMNRKTPLSTN